MGLCCHLLDPVTARRPGCSKTETNDVLYFVLLKPILMKRHLLALLLSAAAIGAWAAPESINLDQNHGAITLDSPVTIYDDGGADGNVGNGVSSTVTFLPALEGATVKLELKRIKLGNTDHLYIYHGRTPEGEAAYDIKGSFNKIDQVISTADDGSLSIKFVTASSHYSSYEGVVLRALTYKLKDLEVASTEVSGTAPAEMVRGSSDQPVARIALNVEGDRLTATANSLSGKIGGASAVKNIKAWYTDKYNGFSPNRLLGSANSLADGTFTIDFAAPVEFPTYGTYYIHVTADLADDAAAGSTVTLGEMAVTSGTRTLTSDATVSFAVKQGHPGGTFTVGGDGADFATVSEAVAALGNAVEGAVTFEIRPGTYAENILVKDIKGTRADRPIILRATAPGVKFTGAGYTGTGTSSSDPHEGVFTIENTSYVTLDGIEFAPKGAYDRTVWLIGASRHCTVSGCSFTNDIQLGYRGNTRNHIYTESVKQVNGTNADYLTVENCTFTGNKHGVYVYGSQGLVDYDRILGTTVRSCTFTDNGSKAIYIYQGTGATIAGNTITGTTAITETSYAAIDLSRVDGAVEVYDNKITLGQEKYSTGIWVRNDCDGTVRPMRIYNNVVALTAAPDASTYGIRVDTDSRNIELAHNSVALSGKRGSCFGLTGNYANAANIRLANNLFQNLAPAGNALYVANAAKAEALSLEGNVLYAEGGDAANVATLTEGFTVEKADFLTDSDLHLKSVGALQCGKPLEYVKKDIDGNWRPTDKVTVGAYEFAPLEVIIPLMAEGYPKVSELTPNAFTLTMKWNVSGTAYAMALEAEAEAPDADRLVSGGAATAITAGSDATVKFGELSDNTPYKVYIMAVSALEAQSGISVADVTTPRYIAPLLVSIDAEEYEKDVDYNVGQTVNIHPTIEGGDKPYTYVWTDREGHEVGTDESLALALTRPDRFTLTVTSADGQTASAYVLIKAYGCADNADFDDNDLAPETAWKGYTDRDYAVYPWFSGGFAFDSSYWAAYSSWNGFGLSNSTSTSFENYNDDCNIVTGKAHSGDSYAVVYYFTPISIHVLADREGARLSHVFVTNNMYAYESVTKGDGFNKPFETGCFLKATFTGDDPEGSPVEVYLADYRSENVAEHTVLTDWQRVDLSPLGKVTKVNVAVAAHNDMVPAYVALDDICYDTTAGSTDAIGSPAGAERVRYYTPDGRIAPAGALIPGIYIEETLHTDGTVTTAKTIIR